jgi:selenium metabolism protein YedF
MNLDHDAMILIKSNGIGDAEPDLALTLIESFINTLIKQDTVPGMMVFQNSGIFLSTDGSPILDQLKALEEAGVWICSCKTCLTYYDRFEKLSVGVAGDMKCTVQSMMKCKKVITL